MDVEEGCYFDGGDSAVLCGWERGRVTGNELTKGTDYTLETDPDDDCTFEVYFENDSLETLEVGDVITVSYSAVVNSNAVIEGSGNVNEITLTYSDPYIWVLNQTEVERELEPEDAVVYRPSVTTTTTTTVTTTTGTTATVYYETVSEEAAEVLSEEREVEAEEEEAAAVLGEERLPQSGQMNWPVPVLSVAGVILFGCGFTIVKKENKKELEQVK